mgnify:CR=1 FL=1
MSNKAGIPSSLLTLTCRALEIREHLVAIARDQ